MDVSIIIRAYNSEETIDRAVESALNQDFSGSFEIIIVNDGSKDGTARRVDALAFHAKIRVIHQENQGAVCAANAGFREALGTFVTLLDADDEHLPHYLASMTSALEANPDAAYAYSDYLEEINGRTTPIEVKELFDTIADNTLYRREELKREGYYRADALFAEYDLLLRTMGHWRGVRVASPLVVYHRRQESVTGDSRWRDRALADLRAHHPDYLAEISRIRSYTLSPEFKIRKATIDDAEVLFSWRNHEDTRKGSRKSTPLLWEDHLSWLEKSIMNPARLLCVATHDGVLLGTARADDRADGLTELSYTIAPEVRGRGLSKPMVLQWVREFLQGKRIVADIKKGHAASESVAEALGLRPTREIPTVNGEDGRPMVEWR